MMKQIIDIAKNVLVTELAAQYLFTRYDLDVEMVAL